MKPMFPDLRKRVKKSGQPPGTLVYTGEKKVATPRLTALAYTEQTLAEASGSSLEDCLKVLELSGNSWLHVEGLDDVALIAKIAEHYQLHPLTVEDILNVAQRPKVEEFDNYLFIILKTLTWDPKQLTFSIEQLSIIIGKDFLVSFQEGNTPLFKDIRQRMHTSNIQRMRQNGIDYLGYRLVDSVVDQYFVTLEGLGEQIESLEDKIITRPSPQNSQLIYRLKRQILALRKVVWPARQAINHLLQSDCPLISAFTHVYLRDVSDHINQVIDTLETFGDMSSSILDIYLSGLSYRMNEIMKVLTIIATIFIPITFLASIYGMNFKYMPELQWHWGYPAVLLVMFLVAVVMLIYFRRNKWI